METPNKDLRRKIVELTSAVGYPHVGTALSMVEILSAIFASIDVKKIKDWSPNRDRLVMSKGHGAVGLYVVMQKYDLLTERQLGSYSENGTLLAGHATHFVHGIEHSTGALGHGLPVGVGMAIGLHSKKSAARVFVVVGDGELNEGSNWEAIMLAGHLGLGNLVVLVDSNGIDQMGKVEDCCGIEPLSRKFESFRFSVIEVLGHDEKAIMREIQDSKGLGKPTTIICRTTKGKGVSFMEGNTLWHYRTPKGDEYKRALAELGNP